MLCQWPSTFGTNKKITRTNSNTGVSNKTSTATLFLARVNESTGLVLTIICRSTRQMDTHSNP